MEVFLAATKYTPEVIFDFKKGILIFKGFCTPIDAIKFFDEVEQIIETKLPYPLNIQTLQFELEYFNTASNRRILDILKNQKNNSALTKKVVWVYEKEDNEMLDAGLLLEQLSDIRFSFIAK